MYLNPPFPKELDKNITYYNFLYISVNDLCWFYFVGENILSKCISYLRQGTGFNESFINSSLFFKIIQPQICWKHGIAPHQTDVPNVIPSAWYFDILRLQKHRVKDGKEQGNFSSDVKQLTQNKALGKQNPKPLWLIHFFSDLLSRKAQRPKRDKRQTELALALALQDSSDMP